MGREAEGIRSGRERWWRDSLRRRLLAAADALAATVGTVLVATGDAQLLWALVLVPVWLVIAKLVGLYDRDHRSIRHLTVDELPGILAWALIGTFTLAGLLLVTSAEQLTPGEGLELVVIAAVAGTAFRSSARALWRRITPRERSLIAGDGELAAQVERKLTLFHDMHLEPIGSISSTDLTRGLVASRDSGALDSLLSGVERVIVATDSLHPETIAEFATICSERQVKLSVVSVLRGRALPSLRMSQVADLPIFEFNTWDVSRSTILVKRAFDVIFAALGLIATAPLWPLIGIAIKLGSRGPVFFAQPRAGLQGRPFRMLKFRTMRADAPEHLTDLVRLDELEEPMFKLRRDPRVTGVGRFLRRLSLDELPQLLNVLQGAMSIVGPRPEQLELVARYRPEHRFRLDVKPGMTGPMQVNGRGRLTFAERLAVELDYVENLSFARDLRMLALTIPTVLSRRGAY